MQPVPVVMIPAEQLTKRSDCQASHQVDIAKMYNSGAGGARGIAGATTCGTGRTPGIFKSRLIVSSLALAACRPCRPQSPPLRRRLRT